MALVCVFCGSESGKGDTHVTAARDLGLALTDAGHTLVYGGGSLGLMGVIANSMLDHGGHVIGVIPEALASLELMHAGVTDMRIVADMHVRKAAMHSLADGYIALSGGFGTMEELFEALCWAQLDLHKAPIALLNVDGMYDGLIRLLDEMVRHGFLSDKYRELLTATESPEELRQWLTRTF